MSIKRAEGQPKSLPSRTVDETVEARCASHYAYQAAVAVERLWTEALADKRLEEHEIARLLAAQSEATRRSEHAFHDIEAVVPMIEETCQRVIIGTQWMLDEMTANAARIAATVGIEPPSLPDAA